MLRKHQSKIEDWYKGNWNHIKQMNLEWKYKTQKQTGSEQSDIVTLIICYCVDTYFYGSQEGENVLPALEGVEPVVNYLLFMNDLKLFSKSDSHIDSLLKTE